MTLSTVRLTEMQDFRVVKAKGLKAASLVCYGCVVDSVSGMITLKPIYEYSQFHHKCLYG